MRFPAKKNNGKRCRTASEREVELKSRDQLAPSNLSNPGSHARRDPRVVNTGANLNLYPMLSNSETQVAPSIYQAQ
jgi:hypothetical protein